MLRSSRPAWKPGRGRWRATPSSGIENSGSSSAASPRHPLRQARRSPHIRERRASRVLSRQAYTDAASPFTRRLSSIPGAGEGLIEKPAPVQMRTHRRTALRLPHRTEREVAIGTVRLVFVQLSSVRSGAGALAGGQEQARDRRCRPALGGSPGGGADDVGECSASCTEPGVCTDAPGRHGCLVSTSCLG